MSKNKKTQAVINPTEEKEVDELEEMDDEMTGEDINEMAEDAEEEAIVKTLSPEQVKERIHSFLIKLQTAKANKETGDQKKIRRNLRKLGFYISKEKEKVMEILLQPAK